MGVPGGGHGHEDAHHAGAGEGPEDVAWSSDGRRLAFSRDDRIIVMNADGSNARRVPLKAKPASSPRSDPKAAAQKPRMELDAVSGKDSRVPRRTSGDELG